MSDPRLDLGTWDIVAGDPLTITVNITSGGTGVNLTTYGSSWAAMLRVTPAASPAVSFTVNTTNAATGQLILSLTASDTAGLATAPVDGATWQFDLQATGGTVTPQTPFRGALRVVKPYTHA